MLSGRGISATTRPGNASSSRKHQLRKFNIKGIGRFNASAKTVIASQYIIVNRRTSNSMYTWVVCSAATHSFLSIPVTRSIPLTHICGSARPSYCINSLATLDYTTRYGRKVTSRLLAIGTVFFWALVPLMLRWCNEGWMALQAWSGNISQPNGDGR